MSKLLPRIVLTTFPEEANVATIAETLVREKLAGCVQILPNLTSIYSWEGAINKDKEQLVLIKTLKGALKPLMARIRELHPYDTPEIMAIKARNVDHRYLDWLQSAVDISR